MSIRSVPRSQTRSHGVSGGAVAIANALHLAEPAAGEAKSEQGGVVGFLVMELGAEHGAHRHDVFIHQPDQAVERMNTGRQQHAAAGCFAQMPVAAIVLHPELDDPTRSDERPAERSFLEHLPGRHAGQGEMHEMGDHQLDATGGHSSIDRIAGRRRRRHRLFQHDVLAGLCCADGHFGMKMVRAGDEDSVDILVVQQLAPVGIAAATVFSGEAGQGIVIPAARCDEMQAVHFLDCPCMGRAEIASPDNAYSNHRLAFSYAASISDIAAT